MSSNDIKTKIKEANDIADVVGEFVTLKKSGVNLVGICPFHPDTKPSVVICFHFSIFEPLETASSEDNHFLPEL